MTQLPVAVDPGFAVRSFRSDPNWTVKVGLGGILNAICLLIVGAVPMSPWYVPIALAVWALVNGYLLRAAKALQEDPAPLPAKEPGPAVMQYPEWNQWGDLLFGGLTWVAVQFGWTVLAAIPVTIATILSGVGAGMYANNIVAVTVLTATVGLTVLFAFLGTHLLLSYLMLNFAAEEKLSAAFNVPRVVSYLIRAPKALFTAWILAFQLQLVSVVLPAMTILGILFVPSTFFAAQLLGISIMAQAWRGCVEQDKYARAVQPQQLSDSDKES